MIYTGLRQTPEQIVAAALQEDADVDRAFDPVGRPHAHLPAGDGAAQRKGARRRVVVVGGIIPDVDIRSCTRWA